MAKTKAFGVFITSSIVLLSTCVFSAPFLVSCGSQTASQPYADTVENRKKWGKLYTEYMDVLSDKKYDEAEKLCVEMEKYQPSSGPSCRSEIAVKQGNYEEADKQMALAIKLSPESSAYWEYAAIYAYHLKHYKEAVERATKAIELKGADDKLSSAYLIRGIQYRRDGQYQKALAEFDGAIKSVPENVEAFYLKGTCLDALGKTDEALAAYAEALRWEPNLQSAIKRRLAIFMRLRDRTNAKKELARSAEQAKVKMMASAKDWIPSDLTTAQVQAIEKNPKVE
ncbi:MAG: hypothetical protein DKT66_23200 [Candidatus Melainabacteria bacterium]|nr:MAG: hypothetical protein DKT66_23200 [Candidatus Melainabacteria bacterium]